MGVFLYVLRWLIHFPSIKWDGIIRTARFYGGLNIPPKFLSPVTYIIISLVDTTLCPSVDSTIGQWWFEYVMHVSPLVSSELNRHLWLSLERDDKCRVALVSAGEQNSHGTLGKCEWLAAKVLLSIRPCPSHPLPRGRGESFFYHFSKTHMALN